MTFILFYDKKDIYSDGPSMVGNPTNDLKPGNQLRFTCSFRKSRPKPILSWFVDSQEVIYNHQLKLNSFN